MGYRSEVVLVVSKDVMPQFMVTMAKSPEARKLCWSEHDRMIKDYDGEGNILFAWGGIKWYDSYEGIRAIEDFMDWCDGEDIPVSVEQKAADKSPTPVTHLDGDQCYRFIRIGEDSDDNIERGWLTHDVHITREVSY